MKKYLAYFILASLPISAAYAFTAEEIELGYFDVVSAAGLEPDQHVKDYYTVAAAEEGTPATETNTVSEALEDNAFEVAEAIDDYDLDRQRGTFSPATSYLLGDSSNNTSINSVTGQNNISDSAFNNANGVVSVIQNSGNNVVIQSSTVVNLEMCAGEC